MGAFVSELVLWDSTVCYVSIVIFTAAVKQGAKVGGPLVFIHWPLWDAVSEIHVLIASTSIPAGISRTLVTFYRAADQSSSSPPPAAASCL